MTELIHVHDDVLPNAEAFRARALAQRFRPVHDGIVRFEGMAACPDPAVAMFLVEHYPGLIPTLSFFRHSPEGQPHEHYIHEDRSVGTATALYYMNPEPPEGDGSRFWRYRPTGAIAATTELGSEAWRAEAQTWFDLEQWECCAHVPAKFNRLVVFPSNLWHSRAIFESYGA